MRSLPPNLCVLFNHLGACFRSVHRRPMIQTNSASPPLCSMNSLPRPGCSWISVAGVVVVVVVVVVILVILIMIMIMIMIVNSLVIIIIVINYNHYDHYSLNDYICGWLVMFNQSEVRPVLGPLSTVFIVTSGRWKHRPEKPSTMAVS